MRRSPTALFLALALLGAPGCGQALQGAVRAAGTLNASSSQTGEIVVRFKPQAKPQQRLQALGLRTVRAVKALNVLVVKAADPAAALAALRADKDVAYATPNQRRSFLPREASEPGIQLDTGADELMDSLWGMKRIHAPEAWQVSTGSRAVKVAVIDTGVDYTHPDLGDRVVKGRDFIDHDEDPMDLHGHGTHCSGTIAAGIGNGGVIGVCPEATILAVRVLDKEGWGEDAGVAEGIIYAVDNGASILNLSLGGAPAPVIDDAVAYAAGKGALVVAAMGNENSGEPSYPGASKGAMGVAAIQAGDLVASYSNWGPHCSVTGPGSYIMSTLPGPRWARRTGTSMATPHVAGVAALLKSVRPDLDGPQLRTRIEASCTELVAPGWDKWSGWGCVDAAKALAAVGTRKE